MSINENAPPFGDLYGLDLRPLIFGELPMAAPSLAMMSSLLALLPLIINTDLMKFSDIDLR